MQRLARSLPRIAALIASLLALAALPAAQEDNSPPIRVALRARTGSADLLTPLRYLGGFETKTLIYETLVKRGANGRLEPGLASWRIGDDGRTFHFTLRPDATFHDDTPVTARDVQIHFRRWVGLPEHDWLAANRRIQSVEVTSEREFTIRLDRPYPLLADLCAINPCAIVGPGARDWEGEFQRPIGSGPFHFAGVQADGSWRLEREAGVEGPPIDIHPYARDNFHPDHDTDVVDALRRGRLEAFITGWDENLPGEVLDELEEDPAYVVEEVPGSAVVYLTFRGLDGPTADLEVRRRIAAAIDRDALIADVEAGRAEACVTWAAPAIEFWPKGLPPAAPTPPAEDAPQIPLRIAAGRLNGRAHRTATAVARQLSAHGFDVEVVDIETQPTFEEPNDVGTVYPLTSESGEVRSAANRELRRLADTADLRVEITHGAPYDPQLTLVSRWGSSDNHNEDEPRPVTLVDPVLQGLIEETLRIPDEGDCEPVYRKIQERMDEQAIVVPLYSPHRIAVHSSTVDGIKLSADMYHVDLSELRWLEPDVEP